jgi:hypothetical protein
VANQGLVFKPVKWSPEVAASLSKATSPDEAVIEDEVKRGISQCWQVKNYGYLVTRLELEPDKSLVLVAGQGRGLFDVLSVMPNIAKANGAKWIRIHSKRAGMVRMLERLNYLVTYGLGENIFYKKV